jgi:hypothetical protein
MVLNLWTAFYNASAVRGTTSRISSSAEEVNMDIPSDWSTKATIKKMREAYRTFRGEKK